MSICVECNHFELYYVLACGDAAIGESKILLFAGDELRDLQNEIRTVDQAFARLDRANGSGTPEAVVKAQDHLASMLNSYISPMAALPSKHLVQAYAINGKKWTRIRSDKMRNHWRSYRIDKSLLAARDQAGRGNQLARRELAQAFSEASKKIRDDLKSGITYKGQIAKGSVSGSVSDLWDTNWTRWVDAVNESLTYSGKSAYHDLSAGAQLLRGYAGFGVQLGYDPKKNTYGISGSAEARAILAEAKGSFTGYVPHRDGWKALMSFSSRGASQAGRQGELNFGYFRANLTLTASAMVGASIYGTAGVEYKQKRNGTISIKGIAADSKGEIAAGAFAGVEAGGSAKGAIEWSNPGLKNATTNQMLINRKWGTIVAVGAQGAVSAGAGAEAVLKITFEGGKFMFRCEARAVLGVGAKGGISGEVGIATIYEFVMYVYNQLKDNNFSYLDFMSEGAFHAYVGVALFMVEFGVDALKTVSTGFDAAINAVLNAVKGPDEAEAYARKIKARPQALSFSPPEVKGAVLYRLTERYTFSFEEHQEAAVLVVLETMQSKSEWDKVVERITRDGRKSTRFSGMNRLERLLDGGSHRRFHELLARINALPARIIAPDLPVNIRYYA